jgi:hypothetical protein
LATYNLRRNVKNWNDVNYNFNVLNWVLQNLDNVNVDKDLLKVKALNVEGEIIADSVKSNWIYTGSIHASQITAGTIVADSVKSSWVYTGSIDASQITTGTLIADSVKSDWVYTGNINADQISGGTIKAGVVFAGQLNAATGTFSGSLSAATGTFRGVVEGYSGGIKRYQLSGSTLTLYDQDGVNVGSLSGGAYSTLNLYGTQLVLSGSSYVSISGKTRLPTNTYIGTMDVTNCLVADRSFVYQQIQDHIDMYHA